MTPHDAALSYSGVMTDRQTPPEIERVDAKTAAEMIGVSIRTIDRYQAAGMLTPLAAPLKPRYFNRADVEALLQPKAVAS